MAAKRRHPANDRGYPEHGAEGLPRLGKRGSKPKFDVEAFVDMLARGWSQKAIAEKLGMTQPNVSVWSNKIDIAVEVARRRTAAAEGSIDRLRGARLTAIDTLLDACTLEDVPWAVRVSAACEILDRTEPSREGVGEGTLTADDVELARRFLAERDAEAQAHEH